MSTMKIRQICCVKLTIILDMKMRELQLPEAGIKRPLPGTHTGIVSEKCCVFEDIMICRGVYIIMSGVNI